MDRVDYTSERLKPTLEQLQEEYLLYISWKKASKYVRYHNWYSDTLELDFQSLRLTEFIKSLKKKLENPSGWASSKLVHVPAPKSHKWVLKNDLSWRPEKASASMAKLRPLAHLSLNDQVITTAIMLCVADTVETIQGNPELDFKDIENRKKIVSYGNRLQCDIEDNIMYHRWGNSNLYRLYYKDYQAFLERSEYVLKECDKDKKEGYNDYLILLDLGKFYDCIRPSYLSQKIRQHIKASDEFYQFVDKVFNWQWEEWGNKKWPSQYSQVHGIKNYNAIALPQGLVSAGFFSNIVLLDFDSKLKSSFREELCENITLIDGCRYVDDVRVVIRASERFEEREVIEKVVEIFQGWLEIEESSLFFSTEKSHIANQASKNKYIVPQSKSATRIQSSVSGTFDAHKGGEIINAIEGFFHTQYKYSQQESEDNKANRKQENIRLLIGMSDMRDDTATRFAANKFRRVYRSLRPLVGTDEVFENEPDTDNIISTSLISKQQLDERAQIFSAMLIDEWVKDPSNIRLLRVALDIFPSNDYLGRILLLLEEGWRKPRLNPSVRMVKQYCLSEIFRAGAVETGLVADQECLPDGIDLNSYHSLLTETANDILKEYLDSGTSARLPWYLMQQVFLYLFTRENEMTYSLKGKSSFRLKRYFDFYRFLNSSNPNNETKSIFLTLAYQSFNRKDVINKVNFSHQLFKQISSISPSFLLDVWRNLDDSSKANLTASAVNCGIHHKDKKPKRLPDVLREVNKPFLNELNLVIFAESICSSIDNGKNLTPWDIFVENYVANSSDSFNTILDWKYEVSNKSSNSYKEAKALFTLPTWVKSGDHKKKYLLGLILRFVLVGSIDSYKSGNSKSINADRYRAPVSHWEKFRYGNYHGREAFADEWVPLSSWAEKLLYELLKWPGSISNSGNRSYKDICKSISKRKKELWDINEQSASGQLFLQQDAPLLSDKSRRLRVGIVQSMLPTKDLMDKYKDFDQLLNGSAPRSYLRNHLTCLLEGINQMLKVRKSHVDKFTNDLNLVVFPEIAVHIDDVSKVLLPFARQHKCLILAGVYYYKDDDISPDKLVNTAVWVIPTLSAASGNSYKIIQQGKKYITKMERDRFGDELISFRPAQWIINYYWKDSKPALRLSASVCYDATDMQLMSDLRNNNHLYIVSAYNKDVGTFDRIAESSHYQMFQGVLMVNNGNFGGSNCYFPFEKDYYRQVLHVHGQPQAQIAFVDIDPEHLICKNNHFVCAGECECLKEYEECMKKAGISVGDKKKCKEEFEKSTCKKLPRGAWKTPPAGYGECQLKI